MTKNKRDLHGERKRDLYGNYIKINFVWQIQVRFVDYTDYTSYFQELEVDQKSFLSFEGNKLRIQLAMADILFTSSLKGVQFKCFLTTKSFVW